MELNHKCNGCRYRSEHQEMGFRPFGVCTKETNLIEAEKAYKAETCPYGLNKKIENLNAEQVKRGLECCANNDECVGEECPYYATGCENNMPKDDLALINSQEQRIKEIAEEVEDLKVTLLARTMALTTLKAVKEELTEKNERLQKHNAVLIEDNHILSSECIQMAKADTVRKMQEELKKTFSALCKGEMGDLYRIIDQIAKEMLEGENER